MKNKINSFNMFIHDLRQRYPSKVGNGIVNVDSPHFIYAINIAAFLINRGTIRMTGFLSSLTFLLILALRFFFSNVQPHIMMNLRKYFLKRKLAVLRIYPRVQILGKVSYRSSRIVFPKVYRTLTFTGY